MARRRDIEAGRAFVRLGVKNELKKQLSGALKTAGTAIAGFSVAAVGAAAVAGAALAKSIKDFAAYGDSIHKASLRAGVAAEVLSELDFAAQRSGASLEDVEKGFRGMARLMLNAGRGLSTATDTLDELGLSLSDLEGLKPDERFEKFADAIGSVRDPSTRAALAMQVFGRAGSQLMPLLLEGSEGIAKLREEANRLGMTMSTEDAAAAAKLTDAMTDLNTAIKGASRDIAAGVLGGGELSEGIVDLSDAIAEIDWRGMATEATDAFHEITGGINGIIEGFDNFLTDWQVGILRLEALSREVFGNIAEAANFEDLVDQAIGLPQGVPKLAKQAVGLPTLGALGDQTPEAKKRNRVRQAEILAEVERLRREQDRRRNARGGGRAPGFSDPDFSGIPEPGIDLSGSGGPAVASQRRASGRGAVAAFLEESPSVSSQAFGGPSGVTFSSAAAAAAGFGSGRSPEKIMEEQLTEFKKLVGMGDKIVMGLTHS